MREDLQPLFPALITPSSNIISWPPEMLETFKCINICSGETLALAISKLRDSLGFTTPLASSASLGISLFFDQLMRRDEVETWFGEVIPRLLDLLLRLPDLLESHYQNGVVFNGKETGLRLLEQQQSGIVFLSQELIAAFLVCTLFCLFPTTNRSANLLRPINFDNLFARLYECNDAKQENKIKCIVHYFRRISLNMPTGNVSFERKVLPLTNDPSNLVYPEIDFWAQSTKSLCTLMVTSTGLIEDQTAESLEVDFANKNLGGSALGKGCVQEEIRFMINPELIASILFLPTMADNESIEIVGSERYSNYTGYASSFRFNGNHEDKKGFDSFKRRKTRIIAIDALSRPGKKQYQNEYLLRETNKAFCGFLDQNGNEDGDIGVATGNWGCGAFGGDAHVKVMIQWIAASEASRPFMLYCTFGLEELEKLPVVVQWIVSENWSIRKLWFMLVKYSTWRIKKKKTCVRFFDWVLHSGTTM